MIPIPSDTSWPGFDALKAWLKRQTISFSKVVTGTLNVDQVMQSSNYASGTSGWMVDGAGDAEFNDVTVRGDIISANWDGTVPLSLPDAAATQGFALQSSNGAAQFAGSLDIGGEVTLDGTLNVLSGKITTGTPSLTSGTVLEVTGYSSSMASIDFYKNESIVGFLRYTTTPDQVSLYSGTTLFLLSPTITVAGKIVGAQFEDGDTSNPGVAFYSNTDSGLRYESSGVDDGIYSVVDGTDVGRISSEGAEFYACPVRIGAVDYSEPLLELWPEGSIDGSYRHYSFRRSAAHATLELYGVTAADVSSLVWSATESGTFHIGQLGSATNPAVSSDADRNTGFYWDGSDDFYFATGGTAAGWISSAQDWRIGHAGTTGKAIIRSTANLGSAPNYTWEGSLDDGMFLIADSRVGIAIGGTTRLETNSSGISVTGRVDASTAARSDVFEFASDTDTQISYSSSGVGNFYSNGTIVGQWGSAGLFSGTLTTSNSPNVYMSSSSVSAHYRFTSAAKYKTNISDAQNYLASLNLRPVKFFRPDDGQWHYGFIADELAAQDKLLGVYDDDGEVESYDWMEVLAVMAAKINQATTTIVELEKRISQLEKESK